VSKTEIRIVPAGSDRDTYLPLLLLADESELAVRDYYQQGDLYALADETRRPLGMILAIPDHDGWVELKAVAVDAALHGQGIGKRLLAVVLADLKARGVKRVVVGTGNSDSGPLVYYQKAGFRLWKIERDFFSPARGYREVLAENGIPLRDMVWMDQQL
jgi:GNAT superfamily N-acetyltransferase